MKYIVTKKQVDEMYKMIVDNWKLYRDNAFTLVVFREGKKTDWLITMNDNYREILKDNILFEMKMEKFGIFESVVLKEIGGRRGYTKKEIIDGIQWNITNNYLRSVA